MFLVTMFLPIAFGWRGAAGMPAVRAMLQDAMRGGQCAPRACRLTCLPPALLSSAMQDNAPSPDWSLAKFGVGQPVPRGEDARLLRGQGRYTDDINLKDQAYAYFVRSPHAHADIKSINTSKAAKAPGVLGVFKGEDVA